MANWEYEPVSARVEVDFARLGLSGSGARLSDAFSGEAVSAPGGRLNMEMPARDYRLILIEPAE